MYTTGAVAVHLSGAYLPSIFSPLKSSIICLQMSVFSILKMEMR